MKQKVTVPLKAFLMAYAPETSPPLTVADCITITLPTGQVFRFTSFDDGMFITRFSSYGPDVPTGGQDFFTSRGSRFVRGAIQNKRGVETSTLSLQLAADTAPDLTGGTMADYPANVGLLSLTQAAVAGLLYLSTIVLETVYQPVRRPDGMFSDNGWGSVIKFVGFIGKTGSYRESIQIEICSNVHLLEAAWPYFVLQPSCRWRLFDNGCQLKASDFAVNGTAFAGSTTTRVQNSLVSPSGYFNLGRIVFNSGANAGISRQIKSQLGANTTSGGGNDYSTIVLNDKPSLYLKFNDAVGSSTAADSSGHGYNATKTGTVTFGQPSLLAGDTGTAVQFDGSSGRFSVPMPKPPNHRAGVTFEFWYMLNSGAGAGQPTGMFDTNPGKPQPHNWRNNGEPNDTKPGFEWWRSKPFIGIDPPSPLSPQHCVVVFRGGQTIDVFINGNPPLTATKNGGGAVVWGSTWAIGRSGINTLFTYFDGVLQHFAVYPFAMGLSTVITHYTAGITAPGTGPEGVISTARINLTQALPYAPAAGDTFTAYPGCDRTLRTCEQTFNNKINFGGEPVIPQPEQTA